jgi:hypothetical protein
MRLRSASRIALVVGAIPRALIIAPLAMGIFYLLGAYGWIAGAGTKGFLAG